LLWTWFTPIPMVRMVADQVYLFVREMMVNDDVTRALRRERRDANSSLGGGALKVVLQVKNKHRRGDESKWQVSH